MQGDHPSDDFQLYTSHPIKSGYDSFHSRNLTLPPRCEYRFYCKTKRLQCTHNREGATPAPESWAKRLHELGSTYRRRQQEPLKTDLVHGSHYMSPNSPFHQMIQKMIVAEVDCITREKFKIEHIQAAEEALMDMLISGHAAVTNSFNNASCSYT